MHQGEGDDIGDYESEDSDYDSSPGQCCKPILEKQDRKPEQEPLPVIATGSFSRYVQLLAMMGKESLTPMIAGDHWCSICTQTS